MSYIKLHGGQFKIFTRDIKEGIRGKPGLNILSVLVCSCGVHGMNDISANGLY